MSRKGTDQAKFEAHFTKGEGCWLWTGYINSRGYGRYGRTALAHRIAYELYIGSIPANYDVDHTCHTSSADCPGNNTCLHRRCVNPKHLEAKSHADNMKRIPGDTFRCGHPRTSENTNSWGICVICQRAYRHKRYHGE